MMYWNKLNRYKKLTDYPTWKSILIHLAGLLVPEIRIQFLNKDMMSYRGDFIREAIEHYGRERAQLNKAITKKGKEARSLRKSLDECNEERKHTFADGVREGLNQAANMALYMHKFYEHSKEGPRSLSDLEHDIRKKISE